jgi:filamentous hemagglutinin
VRSANPIQGLPRTGSALKADPHHAFPDLVDNFVGDAQKFRIPTKGPGGKVVRESDLYQLQGSLRGKPGVFEWIVDQGEVTHRRFIPGGTTTGFPNQIPGGQ